MAGCIQREMPTDVPEEHNSVDEMMIPFKGSSVESDSTCVGNPIPAASRFWQEQETQASSATLTSTKGVCRVNV